jgi:hypothetical protein
MKRSVAAGVNERREFTFTDIANEAFRIHVQTGQTASQRPVRDFWRAGCQIADPPRDRSVNFSLRRCDGKARPVRGNIRDYLNVSATSLMLKRLRNLSIATLRVFPAVRASSGSDASPG